MAAQTHREAFPEQYEHPLVGKRVRSKSGTVGTVLRVVGSRFGELAIIDTLPSDFAVSVSELTEVK